LVQAANNPEAVRATQTIFHVDDQVVGLLDKFPKARKHALFVAREDGLDWVGQLGEQHVPLLLHMRELALKWIAEQQQEQGLQQQMQGVQQQEQGVVQQEQGLQQVQVQGAQQQEQVQGLKQQEQGLQQGREHRVKQEEQGLQQEQVQGMGQQEEGLQHQEEGLQQQEQGLQQQEQGLQQEQVQGTGQQEEGLQHQEQGLQQQEQGLKQQEQGLQQEQVQGMGQQEEGVQHQEEGLQQQEKISQQQLPGCQPVPKGWQLGFHAVPSMVRLHLHVVSRDFDSPCLKHKKHWNSFNTGAFKHLDDVVKELQQSGRVDIDSEEAQRLLKQDYKCHVCGVKRGNLAKLKLHIQQHTEHLA
jgi:hypothetical protein